MTNGQLHADLTLARTIEAEHGHSAAKQRTSTAVALLLGRVQAGEEDHDGVGAGTRGNAEQAGEVGVGEGDRDLLHRRLHKWQSPVMALDHLRQSLGMSFLVVDREEVREVIAPRRRDEEADRGDATTFIQRLLAQLLVGSGGLRPGRAPVGPVVDPLQGRREVAKFDVTVQEPCRPDVEHLLDLWISMEEGAGCSGVDSHVNAPALATIGATATASPFRFEDSNAACTTARARVASRAPTSMSASPLMASANSSSCSRKMSV